MTTVGRTAVVTGAGSGLGRHIARALLAAEYRVALAGRREEALKETADGSDAALVVPVDVGDPESVAALFHAVRREWGRLDLLVNNAGVSLAGPVDTLSFADWRRSVDTNLTGAFLCAQQAVRLMKVQNPRGGRIINNGSISAYSPRPASVAYTATKHAITGLTRSTSLDGRAYDIACGQIDIGNAATTRNEDTARGRLQASGRVEVEARIDVRDVAKGVLYMAELPPEANVLFMTVMANKMPYVGRG